MFLASEFEHIHLHTIIIKPPTVARLKKKFDTFCQSLLDNLVAK